MVRKVYKPSARDPLEQSQAQAGENLEERKTVRFSIHWRPCSKKNETKPIRVNIGKRVVWKVAPTAKAEAHEDAIAGLALCELAWSRGQITGTQRAFFRGMCAERAAGDLKRAAFATLLEPLRARRDRHGLPFGADLVRLEIVEHIGKKPGTDWLDVSVSWLEARPKAKRTGLGHDLVNLHAIVADGIRGALIEDDDQAVELAVSRVLD